MNWSSASKEGPDDEERQVHGRADHCDLEGAGGRGSGRGAVPHASFYGWKAKFGGMDVSDAKRLKALEDENAKLKKLLADSLLDNSALKELLSKNMVTPAARREAVAHLGVALEVSERWAWATWRLLAPPSLGFLAKVPP